MADSYEGSVQEHHAGGKAQPPASCRQSSYHDDVAPSRDGTPPTARAHLSVRRYYPLTGGRPLKNVGHLGRDGFAYDTYRPRDFKKALATGGVSPLHLGESDGCRVSFTSGELYLAPAGSMR